MHCPRSVLLAALGLFCSKEVLAAPRQQPLLSRDIRSVVPIDPEVLAIRESVNRNTKAASDLIPWPAGMKEETLWAKSSDGTEFEVRRFIPKSVLDQPKDARPGRAVVFAYGGGFVGGSIDIFRGFFAVFGDLGETQVFAPQWRLAPEHPFSAGFEDFYSAVQYVQKNAKKFNIDPARILVAGQSAGGNIAAAVALAARDRGLTPPLAAQVLRYPTLNDTTVLEANSTREPFMGWSQKQNEIVWQAYMSGLDRYERNDCNTPPYAAPARSKDMSRLPPAHIGVGDYDLFRDECKLYAERLQKAGVAAEYFNYPESPHGFDGIPGNAQGAVMWHREAAFVKRF